MISSIENKGSVEARFSTIASKLLALHQDLRDRHLAFTSAQFPQDLQFLARVYASTRADEIAVVMDWSEE